MNEQRTGGDLERIGSSRRLSDSPNTRLTVGLIAGLAIGTGLMYLLDPRQGNRRRAIARDKLRHYASRSSIVGGKMYRHLRNRLEGVIASVSQSVRPEGSVSDHKLVERIRSTVGRSISHPTAVDFAVHNGEVTVRGYLKPHEAGQLVQAVERIPGVRRVDNQIVDAAGSGHPVQ